MDWMYVGTNEVTDFVSEEIQLFNNHTLAERKRLTANVLQELVVFSPAVQSSVKR